MTLLHFAYGSNMSIKRLKKKGRLPSAVTKTTGSISDYVLKFNKPSIDGSGKGNIEYTGNKEDIVYGAIFEFDEVEKPELDKAEGGYKNALIKVSAPDGEIEAVTYFAKRTDDSLKPYTWYMDYVINGAKENNLPDDYIKKLEAVESIEDPNPELHDI